jgi:hypothetical protein
VTSLVDLGLPVEMGDLDTALRISFADTMGVPGAPTSAGPAA